jgi:SAM-dependent methyltransferase
VNPRDKQRIIDRYDHRFDRHGVSIDTLASGTEERRSVRFTVLSDVGIASGDSVLDVGCGFGDFLDFCRNRGLDIGYTGLDINPRLIDAARCRFSNASFIVADIQTDNVPCHDYVVSSSAFNLRLESEDNYDFVVAMLRRCYALARKGVAIDFLTSYVDYRGSQDAFYYSPERVFGIAKSVTKRVMLRHDYPLFEFCIYLFPDFTGWNRKP